MSESMVERVARAIWAAEFTSPWPVVSDYSSADDRELCFKRARAAIEAMPIWELLRSATISCSGTEVTIQCNDYDVRDSFMNFLCADPTLRFADAALKGEG